jgi:hypothetical protein
MATQPVQENQPHKDSSWRILAEEAAQEKDPQRLVQIVNALNQALDEMGLKKSQA